MHLAEMEREGESPLEPLLPILDEGLMALKEQKRLALVVRFFES